MSNRVYVIKVKGNPRVQVFSLPGQINKIAWTFLIMYNAFHKNDVVPPSPQRLAARDISWCEIK